MKEQKLYLTFLEFFGCWPLGLKGGYPTTWEDSEPNNFQFCAVTQVPAKIQCLLSLQVSHREEQQLKILKAHAKLHNPHRFPIFSKRQKMKTLT